MIVTLDVANYQGALVFAHRGTKALFHDIACQPEFCGGVVRVVCGLEVVNETSQITMEGDTPYFDWAKDHPRLSVESLFADRHYAGHVVTIEVSLLPLPEDAFVYELYRRARAEQAAVWALLQLPAEVGASRNAAEEARLAEEWMKKHPFHPERPMTFLRRATGF